ncbi:MAG: 30S ribosome-binding factor RbfA [Candidatus Cloacimonadales bacterium]|jgi:ribosome-binding factor A|nr:30S ribosome-binding factor RbfA [Candidatus Cloacimonadota bacterium]MDD2650524.1 30S ribosome-binding factor RbfA [Candidatus Cloacimonadota bacterium]MDD3501671.1 30S ribosome-binding factor RbfA [Candidatus Cloacimonadota bacterium]MDX9977315.1 30S ribosome-binding factor RbfA [Candidatus Cloacimonadales bacterium]
MKGIRHERLSKELFRLISTIYTFGIGDDRLSSVRISHIKISNDLSMLKIYYDYTDKSIKKEIVQELMERSSGFIKNQIAGAQIMRRIPQVTYHYDATEDNASGLDNIFAVIQAEKRKSYYDDEYEDDDYFDEDLDYFDEDYEDDYDEDDEEDDFDAYDDGLDDPVDEDEEI